METDLERFIRLMMANGRTDLLPLTLRDFVDRYRRSIGIRKASLKVAVPPPESLLERLKALVRERTGCEAQIDVEVDPSLIGGFVFDIDDAMIDKSVSRQLELIRLQFIEKNRRIV
jgi:F-type H+-transporting ATPase subunit delta